MSGAMVQIPVTIERDSSVSIQEQLAAGIGELITQGTLRPQMRLPATRALSHQLKVSRNTVKIAYSNLISQGYLESRGTAGTYVCNKLPDDAIHAMVESKSTPLPQRPAMPMSLLKEHIRSTPRSFRAPLDKHRPTPTDNIDFSLEDTDATITPDRTWRRLMLKYLPYRSRHSRSIEPAGLLSLREAIVQSLSPLRGMSISTRNSIIVRDDYRAFDLINKALLRRGDKVAVEDPCDAGIAWLLNSHGIKPLPIPVDQQGIVVDRLPSNGVGLVYVSPTHQQPTGVTMSRGRRQQLLDWATYTGAHIVEWDTYGEFCYDDSPMPSLFSMDQDDRVIYVNCFAAWIGPDFELGYCVVPENLLQRFLPVKEYIDRQPAWLDQKVAGDFIASDSFFGHLRRVRQAFKQRRDAAVLAVQEYMPEQRISGQQAGRHLVWQLPADAPSAHDIQQIASKHNVHVPTLFDGFCRLGRIDLEFDPNRILLIGYTALHEENIGEGIARLADMISRYNVPVPVSGGLPRSSG